VQKFIFKFYRTQPWSRVGAGSPEFTVSRTLSIDAKTVWKDLTVLEKMAKIEVRQISGTEEH
jgi:hypothetical protein